MSVGPYGSAPGASVSSVGSLGPAPASRTPAASLGAWAPPVNRAYLPARRSEGVAYPPAAPTAEAKIPSLARRITIGSLRFVPLLVLYVVVPDLGFQSLQGYGITSDIPFATVIVFGLALAVVSTAAYILRPTRAYGPLSVVSSLGKVVYLLYLAGFATIAISISSVGVQLEFGDLLRLLAIVPAFGVLAGIVTTVEDARHPGERLPFDYPR